MTDRLLFARIFSSVKCRYGLCSGTTKPLQSKKQWDVGGALLFQNIQCLLRLECAARPTVRTNHTSFKSWFQHGATFSAAPLSPEHVTDCNFSGWKIATDPVHGLTPHLKNGSDHAVVPNRSGRLWRLLWRLCGETAGICAHMTPEKDCMMARCCVWVHRVFLEKNRTVVICAPASHIVHSYLPQSTRKALANLHFVL